MDQEQQPFRGTTLGGCVAWPHAPCRTIVAVRDGRVWFATRRNKVQTLRKTQEDAEAEDFRACAEHFVRCGAPVLVNIIMACRLMLYSCICSSSGGKHHVISFYQSMSSSFSCYLLQCWRQQVRLVGGRL